MDEAFRMTICTGSQVRTEILKMLFITVPFISIGFSSSKTACPSFDCKVSRVVEMSKICSLWLSCIFLDYDEDFS